MGDKTKALRKENDDLKSELIALKKEFQSLKSKMAEQKDCNDAAATLIIILIPLVYQCSLVIAVKFSLFSSRNHCLLLF